MAASGAAAAPSSSTPSKQQDEVVDEEEFPSLPVLQSALQSANEDDRLEAVQQISVFVSEAYGAEGMELGGALRDSGTVALIAKLVSDTSAEVRSHALLALGNLCSDSVDPNSTATKALLLELGMEKALMDCITSEDESVLLVACATLQNLCHDAAWAKSVVAAGVETRLEKLVAHSDARVVRYASGALKNLTIASATMGAPGPQLSATATDAVRRRELEASVEEFTQRRACRAIGRAVGQMDAPTRLKRLLRAPPEARDVAWLDALSEMHGVIEERVAILEFQHHQSITRPSTASAKGKPPPPPPPSKPPPSLERLQGLLNAAENAVAELLGELPEELNEMPYDSAAIADDVAEDLRHRDRDLVAEEVAEELPDSAGSASRGVGPSSPHRRQTPAAAAASAAAKVAASGGTAEEAAAAGAAAGAAAAAAAAEAAAKSGADGSRSSSPPSKATGSGGGGGGRTGGADEDVAEEVPEEMNGESSGHNMGASGRGIGLGRRGPASALPMDIPAEANREAAEEWHKKARQQHEAGDDAAALRHLDKSLKLCETAAARALHDHIRKYGAGSAAAQAVARVLKAATHHEVMNLEEGAERKLNAAELKKAYRQLSLRLHPDRNHAQHASDAFKRLSEAYTALSSAQEAGDTVTSTTVAATPRPPSAASRPTPRNAAPRPSPATYGSPFSSSSSAAPTPQQRRSDESGDGTPRGPNPVRRRRMWEKALGLGKKRGSVERD